MFGPLTTNLVVDWHLFYIDANPDPDSTAHVGKTEEKEILMYFLVSVIICYNFPYFGRYLF